ncbi:hypothetical protein E1293_46250 [Actinomadura darangshiensis]|uniref:Uncharacterized protein n=1 Tax=Actinomadura darangshiensis TaxID=705336 RepID=A0A4R4ZLJ1_9ACTN|nr:hypothetical protein [Actinomadura darangshiensis]TDD59678.1 hypothetical protein E1293_46250 [Actinomadura darangshiensis]
MKKLLVIPAAAFVLTVGLSACGDSDDGGGGGTISGNGGASSAPATQGGGGTVTGNGGSNGGGSGGGGSKGGGKLTAAQRESLTKLRNCMVKKGYDMPELDPNNPVMAPKNTGGKSTDQVNKDAAACASQSQPSGG